MINNDFFRLTTGLAVLAAAIILLPPFVSPAAGGDNDSKTHQNEIEEWFQSRIERLKRPDGYLSLVGLFPLDEGTNSFGSAEDNQLVFPEKSPEYAGVFTLKAGLVQISVKDGVEILEDENRITETRMIPDTGKPTTVLSMGTFRFFVIERSGRLYIRLKDVESEALAAFEGVDRFPVDESWCIEANFEAYDPPRKISVPNVLGYEFEQTCPGRVVFEVGGVECSLEPTSASATSLFFVFGDETSAVETYGGGRFLVTSAPSEDGKVFMDFNKAYNPPCAFTPFATCPLPHPANRLTVRIEAGELNYGDHH